MANDNVNNVGTTNTNESGTQRVNKITAIFNTQDGVTMTLWRTHVKLGQVTNATMGIPPFKEMKMPNKQVYMQYCRESLVNLLQGGAVPGFHYDPVNHALEDSGLPKKFAEKDLIQFSLDFVNDRMDELMDSLDGTLDSFDITDDESQLGVDIEELYNDGSIKYASVTVPVTLVDTDNNEHAIRVTVQMKSGQLCKPKTLTTAEGDERTLNATNIRLVVHPEERSDKPPIPMITIDPNAMKATTQSPAQQTPTTPTAQRTTARDEQAVTTTGIPPKGNTRGNKNTRRNQPVDDDDDDKSAIMKRIMGRVND